LTDVSGASAGSAPTSTSISGCCATLIARRSDGIVEAWGDDATYTGSATVPVLPTNDKYAVIAAGWSHSLAVARDAVRVDGRSTCPPRASLANGIGELSIPERRAGWRALA
jgi:hypothetical protein